MKSNATWVSFVLGMLLLALPGRALADPAGASIGFTIADSLLMSAKCSPGEELRIEIADPLHPTEPARVLLLCVGTPFDAGTPDLGDGLPRKIGEGRTTYLLSGSMLGPMQLTTRDWRGGGEILAAH